MPHLQFGLVDVRDVARAHILSMQTPHACDGQRFLITTESFWFRDIAKILSKEFGSQGYFISTIQAPYPFVWLYSFIDPESKQILDRLNRKILLNNSKVIKCF